MDRLCDFPNLVKGRIKGYDNNEFIMSNKIIEMDFVILHKASFGGPLYVEFGVEKTRVALRLEEAKFVFVESIEC